MESLRTTNILRSESNLDETMLTNRSSCSQFSKYSTAIMQTYEQEQKEINEIQDAKKILDAFGNLSSESHNATRFIYELLQNAGDQCCEGKMVEVMMKLTKDEFVLSHNGKPFKFIDIINVIKQGSNKDRPEKKKAEEEEIKEPQNLLSSTNNHSNSNFSMTNSFGRTYQVSNAQFDINELDIPETTGRYGTGLLTTYLLSKHLIVSGVLHYDKQDENNFRRFTIQLNRDGQSVSEIKKQIEYSFDQVEIIGNTDLTPLLDTYEEGLALDTSFSYQLYDQSQFDIAAGAIKSLLQTAPFILAFNPKFSKITIDDQTTGKLYTLSIDRQPISNNQNCSLFNYRENETLKTILIVDGRYSCLATIVERDQDGFQNICKLGYEIPNIFVDYPLLGSETLGTSIVFNSHYFDPNEKRSGIPLSSGIKAEQNKFVIKECAQIYEKLVKYILAQRFKGVNNLQINPSERTDRFLRDILVTPCIKIFTENPVVESSLGFLKLNEVLFPDIQEALNSNSQAKLDHLMSLLVILQKEEGNLVKNDYDYIKSWFDILQNQDWKPYFYTQNLRKISSIIDRVQQFQCSQNFYQQCGMDYQEFQSFMNKLYDYLSKFSTSSLITEHRKSSIFLNQNLNFKPITELYQDKLNNEILKTFCKNYGYDIRDKMVSRDFVIPESISQSSWNMTKYTIDQFDSELSSFLENYYVCYKTKKLMPASKTFVISNVNDLLKMCYQTIHFQLLVEQYQDAQQTERPQQIDSQLKQHFEYMESVKQLLDQLSLAFSFLSPTPTAYKFKEVPVKSQKIAISILLQEIYSKLIKQSNVDSMKLSLLKHNLDPYEFLNKFYETIKKTSKVHKPGSHLMNPSILVNQNGDFIKKVFVHQIFRGYVSLHQVKIIFNEAFQDNSFISKKEVDQMMEFYYTFTGNNRHADEKYQLNIKLNLQVIRENLLYSNTTRVSGLSLCSELDKAIILKCNDRVSQKAMEKTILLFDDFYLHAFTDQEKGKQYFSQYEKMRKSILVEIKQSGELNNQLFEILSSNRESALSYIVNIPKESFDSSLKMLQIVSNTEDTKKSKVLLKFTEIIGNSDIDELKIRELIDLVTDKQNE
eukprot:403368868